MTSSSDQIALRGLDAMLIVYSLLEDHPASAGCESFIRERPRWLTTTLTLLEAKAILTKVYVVDTALASQQISQFSAGPIEIIEVDLPMTLAAMQIADTLEIDITDAILVQASLARGANALATDDRKLIQACHQVNLIPETPIVTIHCGGKWQVGRQITYHKKGYRASLGGYITGCISTINKSLRNFGLKPGVEVTYHSGIKLT